MFLKGIRKDDDEIIEEENFDEGFRNINTALTLTKVRYVNILLLLYFKSKSFVITIISSTLTKVRYVNILLSLHLFVIIIIPFRVTYVRYVTTLLLFYF